MRVYGHAKSLFLLGEETDLLRQPARDFVQPAMEIRHAFDHLMRAFDAAEQDDVQQVDANLDKALGHVYRSFFDAADWFCINIREFVTATLSSFSVAAITSAFPQYYEVIRPEVDRATRKIAELRKAKDVTRRNTVPCVEEYVALTDQLLEHAEAIVDSLGAIAECQARLEQEEAERQHEIDLAEAARKRHSWLIALGAGTVVAIIAWLLSLLGRKSPPQSRDAIRVCGQGIDPLVLRAGSAGSG